MLFRARRTLKDGFDDIATGERCERMQTVMLHLTDGRIGLRQERRLTRHLDDCAACRREAVALGLDDLVVGSPSRAKAALARVAGFLPLPAFLRRRWFDGAGMLGSAGPGGAAEQGASLVGKAAVVLAAAVIAGGGAAGVAHKAGAIGKDSGADRAAPAGQGLSRTAGSSPEGSFAAGRGGRDGGGRGTAQNGNGSGKGSGAGAAAPGGGSGSGPSGTAGPLDGAGSVVSGAAGKGGSVAGNLNGAVGGVTNGVGGTVNGVGGTVDGVGKTVDGTVKGVGGVVDNTTKSAGGTVDNTVKGVGGTLDTTVKSVGGTVNGATGTLTQPGQTPTSSQLLP
jgi:hypothetical protein